MSRPIFSPEVIRLYWGLMSEDMQATYEDASAALRVAAIRATDEILIALEDQHERENAGTSSPVDAA